MNTFDTDVLIVGAGPVGVTVGNLLGTYGVRTIIIDKATEIIDYPRGVGLDDESLRVFQEAGLGESVHQDMVQNQALIWFDSKGRTLAEIAPSGKPFGWPRRNSFLQPMLEQRLRTGLERFEHVDLRVGLELETLTQDANGVTVGARDADGELHTLTAKYVVGCDGGRSTVRRLIGVQLVGSTLADRWLVVDIRDSTMHAPYSGNYLGWERPFVSIDLPFGYRRFEFRLNEGESSDEMVRPEAVEKLIRERFDWSGPMPGLERARVYSHHSRVADKFRVGRVLLAGDAAHLQPPWFGQGLNSGLRDAANVAWKVAAMVTYGAADSVLDTYQAERQGHAQALVDLATTLGRFYGPKSKRGEAVRSYGLRLARRIPMAREYFAQMKFKPMPYYETGLVIGPERSSGVGRMFIQPDVETAEGERVRLDEVLGSWFAVIAINKDPQELLPEADLDYWRDLGARFVRVNRSRAHESQRIGRPGTVVVDDVDGGFRDWSFKHPEVALLVVRPDRYLAAAVSEPDLPDLTRKFSTLLPIAVTHRNGA